MVKKKLLKGKGQKRKKSGRYPSYDRALKLLFSHPEMMKALIQGFVPEPWVKELMLDMWLITWKPETTTWCGASSLGDSGCI